MAELYMYPTRVVTKVTSATLNQIQYWVKEGLLTPNLKGHNYYFSFADLIRAKLIASLRAKGLSLQKIKLGLSNLKNILDYSDIPIEKLIIITDGSDMIVSEKNKCFSAISKQSYFQFDTEKIEAEVIRFFPDELHRNGLIQRDNKKTA
jgi:DNA-binding transcriptional MerR regulator